MNIKQGMDGEAVNAAFREAIAAITLVEKRRRKRNAKRKRLG
jgi:hypothetical protein